MASMLLRIETGTVLLMLHQVVMVISYGGITACYSPPDSICSSHFLTNSFGSQLITIERLYYGHKSSTVTKESCDCNNTCCVWDAYGPASSEVPFSKEDRLSVYRNCSHEFSCVIRSPYSPNTGYHYVVYQISSLSDHNTDDIMSITNITDTGWHYLYFAGKSTPTRGLSCSCDITGGEVDLRFYSYYINLNRESCSHVKITADNKPVYNCTDDGVYISHHDIIIYGLKTARIEFIDMTSDYDDAIWIGFFRREAVKYSCDCSKQVMNGGWSDWSYSSCSVSCGSGIRTRSRECNAPTPANGGTNCIGSRTEEVDCTEQECSFEGSWSDWSYSACSVSCGGGTRTRIRKCNIPSPTSGSRICSGETSDDIPCGEQDCPEAAVYVVPWVLFGVCLLINIFTLIWCIIRLMRRKLKQKMSGQVCNTSRLSEINRNESSPTASNTQSVYYVNTVINENNYESLSPTLSDEYGAYASLK
ncbi:uncharacterized protein LOC126827460 [Patella vulgata]|uniref:uncharacterized protein LOC126827460 n=1 Tax=Patella vulgata TaxID=6465 RepID=UPI0024A83891|nr:uncharacterized protein LOC126827460 [Patella vulgata]